MKKSEKELFLEMVNFELGETLKYIENEKLHWEDLSENNRNFILSVFNRKKECCDNPKLKIGAIPEHRYCSNCGSDWGNK